MYRINYENTEEFIRLKNEIEIKTRKLEEMKADFIEQMKSEGLAEKIVGNGKGKVTYTNNPQNRFNQKRFGNDHPELLSEYKELQDRWTLTVK